MTIPAQKLQAVRSIRKDEPSTIFFAKAIFSLGEGQTEGLTYKRLRERFLMSLGNDPLNHPSLLPAKTTTSTAKKRNGHSDDSSSTSSSSSSSQDEKEVGGLDNNLPEQQDSTPEELEEEIEFVKRMMNGKSPKFLLDSTMIVTVRQAPVAGQSPRVTLISPVPCTDPCLKEIDALGEVSEIVAPNLQHWIFVEELATLYPNAKILVAPAALGEDLVEKLPSKLLPRTSVLSEDDQSQFDGALQARLLQGAPLNMNEFVFFHVEKDGRGTLITADGFYGGIRDRTLPTSTFQRLWFKLTKQSFRSARLPIYRTSRVSSHGNPEQLLGCVDEICKDWNFDTILFSHGQNPYNFHNAEMHHQAHDVESGFAQAAFHRSWHDALDSQQSLHSQKAGAVHMIRQSV